MKRIKARVIAPCTAALTLSLLAACGQGGTSPASADDQKLDTSVPSAIRASNLPDSSLLRAFLDVNGERSPMTINGSTAEVTISNLPPGASTVAIVFDYQSPNFGDVVLATATRTLTLQPGQNSLVFTEQDYQFPDDDSDASANLAEIKNNTDPGDPNDLFRQWGVAGPISTVLDVIRPRLAVGPSGDAVAVWGQFDGMAIDILANRFDPGTGWGVADRIEFDDNASALFHAVAMDTNGNGIAVFSQNSGIRARRLTRLGDGVLDRLDLESPDDLMPQFPELAMNESGVAVAVWQQRDQPTDERTSIMANRFDGTAWGNATLIDNSTESATFAEVAVDANGNALAIWRQGENLLANRYVANTGWGTPTPVERLEGASFDPDIAIDSNGNGMVVWNQNFQGNLTLRASHFDATTGMWGTETVIGGGGRPHVAFDAAGNALAIWQVPDHINAEGINANRFDAATKAWGSATPIADLDTRAELEIDHGALAVRASGEAWAVWSQVGSTILDIYANRFDPVAQSWGAPVLVHHNSLGRGSSRATIGLDNNGRGLAVWRESPGTSGEAIWSSRLE